MSEPRLFKYVQPDRVDILEFERIRFTPPLEFNDPFDTHPTVAPITDKNVLWKLASQIGRDMELPEVATAKARSKARRKAQREALQHSREQSEPFEAHIKRE